MLEISCDCFRCRGTRELMVLIDRKASDTVSEEDMEEIERFF